VNKTGLIDFKVYIRDAFDNLYDSAILEEEALSSSALPLSTKTQAAASISNPLAPKSSANDDEFKELKDLYKFEKDKWTFVAERPSDTLTYLQFYMFVYSEEYAEVLDFEARVNFAKFDTNADGFISVDEFLVNVHGIHFYYFIKNYRLPLSCFICFDDKDVDHTMVSVKKRKFSKSLDLDQDNQIELAEFKKWYMPSIEQLVSEELASLIDQCDTDQNQQLAEAEVVKCCRALLNSQLTNYGIDLNPPSQIAQRDFKFNDEL
jgi:Ca2+-binding EF-hand superfamily protein